MKIAIIGHGRMGRLIESIARDRGHKICCIIDADNLSDFESPAFREADVAIEFTTPSTAVDNILRCFAAGVPVVSGTTGWQDSLPEMKQLCDEGKGTLLYASNFSIGVNIFMAVNRYLASIMENFNQYRPSMVETHHIHKLDHPSGTAVTLADEIVAAAPRIKGWEEPRPDMEIPDDIMPVDHVRQGEVPGIHTIIWDSKADDITITHSAKTREGFALGAVLAAEWLHDKKGFRTIGEMLSDRTGTSGIFS